MPCVAGQTNPSYYNVMGVLRKLISILTSRCPQCRFRYGARVTHQRKGVLHFFFIRLFHCNSCNIRFHAICIR